MSMKRRACAVVLSNLGFLALLASLQIGGGTAAQLKTEAVKAAPPAPPGAAPAGDGDFTDAISLPKDREVKKRIEAAKDYIDKDQWVEACRFLQSVLDRKEDVFVQVNRKGANNVDKIRWVSAKTEADRLIGKMPAKGLETYELEYGGLAKGRLAEAKKSGDPQVLAEVAQRYFHTEAGVEATDLLATLKLDRGETFDAAQFYERLLQRHGADQLTPLTLSKAAFAFRVAGAQLNAGRYQQIWKQLDAKVGSDGLQIGDENVTLAQLQKELDQVKPAEVQGASDWAMFRGNISRTGVGRGSAPYLDSIWQRSNLEKENDLPDREAHKLHPATKAMIEQTLQLQARRADPLLPAFLPVATGGRLIYRSFQGIHAVNVQTGKLEWESSIQAGLDQLIGNQDKKQEVGEWFKMYQQGFNHNIIFENTTVGTLSTDNSRVYAVDDLALPPHPAYVQGNPWGGFGGGMPLTTHTRDLIDHSRLIAINLETGKLEWERGDPQHDTTDLGGGYFLGPPLPLAGKLYVLTEKNAELRLVCLDPSDGKPVWAQTLATAKDKLLNDVARRVHAVHLAYSNGILVCPTNAGAVLGIDLLSRSLRWAFPYREKVKNEGNNDQQGRVMRGRVIMFPGQDPNASLAKLSGEWKFSAPIIQDDKVIFTAPDGSAMHCLSLHDGEPLWQAEHRDDLFLAGVFNGKIVIVGKNKCRALSLADGKTQKWEVDTGVPSGMGVASGGSYYLPLRKGEICRIDLERGTLTRSPAPKNEKGESEVPGNLLFYNGDVVSQTETTVTCYPQVEFKVAQISALLKKNPTDPVALSERGELRLYQGDLAGAVADLRDAVQNKPPAAMVPKIRNKLYITLTELLKNDFPAGEQFLAEYKELCNVPIPDGVTGEERQRLESEQRRRQAGYLCLFAEGREKEGRLLEAFQAYLEYGALAEAKELVTVINESSVKVKPDLWAQGRIAAMIARATPEQRKPLEEEIARRWKEVQVDKDPDSLRRFVASFGALFTAGREARLKLAERLIDEGAYLDAELQLEQLSLQRDDPQIAGRGTETLARMWARKGLMEDAAHYYRILARDFANVVIRDGKTGAEILMELTTDKRFWPYLDDMVAPLAGGEVKVTGIHGGLPLLASFLPYEARTDLLPFFQRYTLASSQSNANNQMYSFQLKLLDRDTNEPLWTLASPATRAMHMPYGANASRFPFYAKGHLVVLYLGHTVCAVDLIERKKLWERDLVSQDRFNLEQPWQQITLTLDKEGALYLNSSATGTTEKLGQIGPVTASYVCLRTQEGLMALDPIRGTVLWTKTDLTTHTQVFGDDDHVFLVEVREDNRVGATRAIRGMDGAAVEVPDFAALFQRKLRVLGGKLLVSENDPTGSLVLRLYDVVSGKDLYKKTLPPDAVVLKSEENDLVGVVEPNGKVSVVDLRKHDEVFHATVATEYLEKVKDGLLLQDDRLFYVILNKPSDPGQGAQGPWSNLTLLRSARVNGEVYAFDRGTAKVAWHRSIEHQMILLEQFQELPMMVFTAKYNKNVNAGPGFQTPTSNTLSIDKWRTGKLIYDSDTDSGHVQSGMPPQAQGQFHTLRIDRQNGIVDLISNTMKLRHYVGTNGMAGESSRPNTPMFWNMQPRPVVGPIRAVKPKSDGGND